MVPRHVPAGRVRSGALAAGLAVLLAVPATASADRSARDAAPTATARPGPSPAARAGRAVPSSPPRLADAGGRVAAVKRGVSLGATTPVDAAVGGKTYVAFGDSYSSGPGLAPPREPGCGRSAANWASVVAATFGLGAERDGAWADYSCAGATATEPGAGVTLLDQIGWADRDGALGPGTEAVTFTAGGNDPWAGKDRDTLYRVLEACVKAGTPCGPARRVGPLGQLLPDAVTGLLPSGLAELLASVLAGADEAGRWLAPADVTAARMTARLRPAVAAIRARAPRASIAVVGYPRVVPPAGSPGCAGPIGLGWGLEPGEVAYLDALLVAYDRAQRAAVAELHRTAAPVRFVDLRGPSAGHDLCSGSDAWVNAPILAGLGFGGDSLHPSIEGMDGIAGVVEAFAQATGLTRARE